MVNGNRLSCERPSDSGSVSILVALPLDPLTDTSTNDNLVRIMLIADPLYSSYFLTAMSFAALR